MPTTLRTNLQLSLQPRLATSFGTFPLKLGQNAQFENGSGQGQANLLYAKQHTIADSSTPQTIDLSGSLVMPDGSPAVFVRVKGIYIQHLGTPGVDDANIVSIGGGSNAFANWISAAGTLKVKAGGQFLLIDPTAGGYAVTAATGDILQLATAAGTNVGVLVALLGGSA